MIASVTPNAATTAESRHARSRTRSRTVRARPLPPNAAIAAAAAHSRSPVNVAGDTSPNIRPASPAPT